jgi:hypothetical protein
MATISTTTQNTIKALNSGGAFRNFFCCFDTLNNTIITLMKFGLITFKRTQIEDLFATVFEDYPNNSTQTMMTYPIPVTTYQHLFL